MSERLDVFGRPRKSPAERKAAMLARGANPYAAHANSPSECEWCWKHDRLNFHHVTNDTCRGSQVWYVWCQCNRVIREATVEDIDLSISALEKKAAIFKRVAAELRSKQAKEATHVPA